MWLLTLCNTIAITLMLVYGRSPVHVHVTAPAVKLSPTVHKRANGDIPSAPMVRQTSARHAPTPRGWHRVHELE